MIVYVVLLNDRLEAVCDSASAARMKMANTRARVRGQWIANEDGSWTSASSGSTLQMIPREVES